MSPPHKHKRVTAAPPVDAPNSKTSPPQQPQPDGQYVYPLYWRHSCGQKYNLQPTDFGKLHTCVKCGLRFTLRSPHAGSEEKTRSVQTSKRRWGLVFCAGFAAIISASFLLGYASGRLGAEGSDDEAAISLRSGQNTDEGTIETDMNRSATQAGSNDPSPNEQETSPAHTAGAIETEPNSSATQAGSNDPSPNEQETSPAHTAGAIETEPNSSATQAGSNDPNPNEQETSPTHTAAVVVQLENDTQPPDDHEDVTADHKHSNTQHDTVAPKPVIAEDTKKLQQVADDQRPQNDQNHSLQVEGTITLVDLETKEKLNFIYVPPGKYHIGYSEKERVEACRAAGDPGFANNASVSHTVNLKSSFYILDREVTSGQWNTIMGTPAAAASSDSPAPLEPHTPLANVTWEDASVFCHRVSEKYRFEKYRFIVRLPAEVEWECAAGVSGEGVYPWGKTGFHANAGTNSKGVPQQVSVDGKDVTPSGIYDMAGNLSEWCSDEYTNFLRGLNPSKFDWHPSEQPQPTFQPDASGQFVLVDTQGQQIKHKIAKTYRGGSYSDLPHQCQIPVRRHEWHTAKLPTVGFRPILVHPRPVDGPN